MTVLEGQLQLGEAFMPRPTPEMMKADAVEAWRKWAANAPLGVLEAFDGPSEIRGQDVGPHHRHRYEIHVDTEEEVTSVVLQFTPDEDDPE